jgi:hypothetical protein
MSYHNLSNEEIVFLYYVGNSVVSQYEEVYKDSTLTQSISTDMGLMELKTELPKELLDEMLKSKHYLIMKQIVKKLQPIYILIKDVEPELVEEMDKLFNYKLKE